MRTLAVTLVAIFLAPLVAEEPATSERVNEKRISADDREHWAFQAPKAVTPSTKRTNPIDAFIDAKLAEVKLTPAPRADKLTLIRRVSFDLTGLPPTVAELDTFLNDDTPTAYDKLVDRLLASPHYGERWATHWLDVVRFAESNGYELDADRPNAWRYRDYVIRSFNADKPYNTFLKEQIAGDELANGKDPQEPTVAELLIATGMHRCGPAHMVSGNTDKELLRQEYLTEMVNGLGSAVFGLTIGCARCHNHKSDPISAADYYRLQAFFAAAQYQDVSLATAAETNAHKAKIQEIKAKTAPIRKQIEALDAPVREKLRLDAKAKLTAEQRAALDMDAGKRTPEQKKIVQDVQPLLKHTWLEVLEAMPPHDKKKRDQLREQLFQIEDDLPPPLPAAWAIVDNAKRPPTHVLKRGSHTLKAQVVSMGFPRILDQRQATPTSRVELADWLTANDHPLTARVMVNRIWHHYFGKGLVASVNDFGINGEKPTHPELLDWLATDLVRNGWKLKRIHKLIVTSEAYRRASSVSPTLRTANTAIDPSNERLWRMNRKRLEAEAIRDATLVSAGTLNRAIYGPSVRVPLEPEVYDLIFTEGEPDGLWRVTKDASQHTRRSIYLLAKRNVRLPMFEAFDQPDTLTPCTGRGVSTFAPQALILMNGPFTNQQSRELAKQLLKESPTDREQWMTSLYRRTLGREPTLEERQTLRAFLLQQATHIHARLSAKQSVNLPFDLPPSADPAFAIALVDACLAVLNLNEFVYVN